MSNQHDAIEKQIAQLTDHLQLISAQNVLESKLGDLDKKLVTDGYLKEVLGEMDFDSLIQYQIGNLMKNKRIKEEERSSLQRESNDLMQT